MLKRLFKYLLCALLLAAALVYWLPAQWLAHWVQSASGQRVLLTEAQGRLLAGEAGMALAYGRSQYALPGRIQWRLDGWRLLQGEAWLEFSGPMLQQPLQLRVPLSQAGREFEVSGNQLELPMAFLSGLGAPINSLDLQGQLRLRFESVRMQAGQLQTNAVLELNQVNSRASPVNPLGQYQVQLNARAAQPIDIKLTSTQGPLFLSGEGQLAAGKFRFEGEAKAAPSQQEALRGLLYLLGPKTEAGARLRW